MLALPAALAPQATAPTPRPLTIEVGIEVIQLTLSVSDADNRFVTDLQQGAFAIYEDSVRQETALFIHERLPISLSILIDTSASMEPKIKAAQEAARRFIATLVPGDAAELIQFNDRTTTLQGWTREPALLDKALERLSAAGSTSLHNALYATLKGLVKQRQPGRLRRLAIVLLSDGEDTSSLVDDEQVLELARQAEIAIYSIRLSERRAPKREGEFSQAAFLLASLAQESGGNVFFPTSLSELDAVYDRIAEELRTQYIIGYISSNKKRDGKWRRVVVRVPAREGLAIRHKLGYFGPRQAQ
jgi:Ca-activated chloride channel family protein